VLQLLAQGGAVDIVLGAWGCGVFGNEPLTVAKLFKQHLSCKFKGHFRKVVFAITDPRMAAAFEHVFWGSLSQAEDPESDEDNTVETKREISDDETLHEALEDETKSEYEYREGGGGVGFLSFFVRVICVRRRFD